MPFGDGRSIRALVTDVLGEPGVDFPSTMLDQFATRRSVNLFIIDPLVLLHQQKASLLVDRIQEHICSADKAFCIILPQNLPQPFREQLRRRYEAQLPDLKGQPLSEFEVERFDRLEQFLTRIEDYLRGYPTRAQFEQSKRVFSVMGINPVALQPTIGAG